MIWSRVKEENTPKVRSIPTFEDFQLHLGDRTLILHDVKLVKFDDGLYLIGNPCILRLRQNLIGICAYDQSGFIGCVRRLPNLMLELLGEPRKKVYVKDSLDERKLEEVNAWKHYLYRNVRIACYSKNNVLTVKLCSTASSIFHYVPLENKQIPTDFTDHNRIREPFLTRLAMWMTKQGMELTSTSLVFSDIIHLGVKEILIN